MNRSPPQSSGKYSWVFKTKRAKSLKLSQHRYVSLYQSTLSLHRNVPVSFFITNWLICRNTNVLCVLNQYGKVCVAAGEHFCLITLGGFILVRERQADVSASSHQGKDPSVRNHIPGQRQSDVLIGPAHNTDVPVSLSHSGTWVPLGMQLIHTYDR